MEKAMAPHSSTLAWKVPWMEEPGGLQSMGSLRVGHDWATSLSLFLLCIGEGNGNPLQCSWLENPRDSGAWWAAVYGVAQSQTRVKRLRSNSSSSREVWGEDNRACIRDKSGQKIKDETPQLPRHHLFPKAPQPKCAPKAGRVKSEPQKHLVKQFHSDLHTFLPVSNQALVASYWDALVQDLLHS